MDCMHVRLQGSSSCLFIYSALSPTWTSDWCGVNGIVVSIHPRELSLEFSTWIVFELLLPSTGLLSHLPLPATFPPHVGFSPRLTINTAQPPTQCNASWTSHHVLIKRWKVMGMVVRIQYSNGTMGIRPNRLEVVKVQRKQWRHHRIVSLLSPRT